jgi:hypothetical protein
LNKIANRQKTYVFIILVMLLNACTTNTPSVERVKERTILPNTPLPAPASDIILTVTNIANSTESVVIDRELFEQFGTVAYTVTDPWLQQEVRYTGVLLTDLLEIVGAENAVEVQVIALDGYNAAIPATIFNEYPVLIAYQANGEWLDIVNNGPARIIFPYDDYPDITEARNLSVWNLDTIEIK